MKLPRDGFLLKMNIQGMIDMTDERRVQMLHGQYLWNDIRL